MNKLHSIQRKYNILLLKTEILLAGGAENIVYLLCKHRDSSLFNYHVIVSESGPIVEKIRELEIPVSIIKMKGITDLWKVVILLPYVIKHNINLIHVHGARVNVFACLVSQMTGIPIIATEHNINAWRENLIMNTFDRIMGIMNKKRVAVSQGVAKSLIESRVVPKDKVTVIYNGIETSNFDDLPCAIKRVRKEFGINDTDILIGSVGRLSEEKGYKYLVEAAKIVCEKYNHAKIMIVGPGKLREVLYQQISKLNLRNKFILTGYREDIPEILQSFDIFVLPSLTEGLPLSLLEAMASGKPVVASAVGGTPEVIQHGVTGILVPPKDSQALAQGVISIIRDKTYTLYGKAGKLLVQKNFDFSRTAAEYKHLYLQVLNRSNGV